MPPPKKQNVLLLVYCTKVKQQQRLKQNMAQHAFVIPLTGSLRERLVAANGGSAVVGPKKKGGKYGAGAGTDDDVDDARSRARGRHVSRELSS